MSNVKNISEKNPDFEFERHLFLCVALMGLENHKSIGEGTRVNLCETVGEHIGENHCEKLSENPWERLGENLVKKHVKTHVKNT